MLNILLVEDEFVVRKGLEAILHNQQSVELSVSSACDALSALKIAESQRPDVVITDVSMPEMDGFSMIESMQQQQLCSRFIIITGFERLDFTYQALQLQVVDYLVKPIDKTRLILTLTKLDEDKETQLKQALINVGYFLQNEGTVSPPALDELSCRTCFPHQHTIFLCALSRNNLPLRKNHEFIDRLEHFFPVVRCFQIADAVVYALNQPEKVDRQTVEQAIQQAVPEFEENYLGIGDLTSISDHASLTLAWITALVDMLCRMIGTPHWQAASIRAAYTRTDYSVRGLFVSTVQMYTMKDPAEIMLAQNWIRMSPSPMQLLYHYALTDFLLYFFAHRNRDALQRVIYWHQSQEKTSAELQDAEIHHRLHEMVSVASPYLSIQCRPVEYSERITQALRYIQQHFREDLSLNDVAQKVNLQPTYLSHLFRKEVGCSFLHILHDTRIKAACHLLRYDRSMSVEEIAKEAGYQTPNYFFTIFKKYMGVSPRKFREKELGKDSSGA